MSQFPFQTGQHVKHKLGTQPMIVVKSESAGKLVILDSLKSSPRKDSSFFTGHVLCSWVDANNFPQKAYFYAQELEVIN